MLTRSRRLRPSQAVPIAHVSTADPDATDAPSARDSARALPFICSIRISKLFGPDPAGREQRFCDLTWRWRGCGGRKPEHGRACWMKIKSGRRQAAAPSAGYFSHRPPTTPESEALGEEGTRHKAGCKSRTLPGILPLLHGGTSERHLCGQTPRRCPEIIWPHLGSSDPEDCSTLESFVLPQSRRR